MSYTDWKDRIENFQKLNVRHVQGNFFPGIQKKAAALDDVFELLAWNQGIGFFSSEIGPGTLFQAYKLIKNQEKQGKAREEICAALKEKFGEKNPEVQV